MKRLNYLICLILLSSVLIAGCNNNIPAEAANEVARQFMTAVFAGDKEKVVSLTCGALQGQIGLQFEDFFKMVQGAQVDLTNLRFEIFSQTPEVVEVKTVGNVRITANGQTTTLPPLTSTGSFVMRSEGGHWKYCGQKSGS